MRVDQFHDGHGADQEEQDPRRFGEPVHQLAIDEEVEFGAQAVSFSSGMRTMPGLEQILGYQLRVVQRVDGPAQHTGQQRAGGLVHVNLVLERNG